MYLHVQKMQHSTMLAWNVAHCSHLDSSQVDQSGNEKNYLAQHISPDKNEVMTVKTAGSIVPTFKGKKSFQYMVSFSYGDYLNATLTTRQLEAGGQDVPVRVFTKKFVTNTETSASRVYAYNKYFDLGSDNFINGTMKDFEVSFSDDKTATYGVGRTIKLNITAGEAGKYLIESNTLQSPTRAVLAELDMTANQSQTIDLVTSTFANRGKVLVTCMATGVMKEIFAVERNMLDAKAVSAKYNGTDLAGEQQLNVSESEDDALRGEGSASVTVTTLKNRTTIKVPDIESEDDILYFSYINGNKLYIASATAGDLIAGTAALEFEEREIVVSITDLALSGSQYYGIGRDVTLTFNVTKTGTYTITQTEGSQTKTYTHEANSIGEQTVTLKTLTWGTQLNVTVSTTVGGATYSESVVGEVRKVLKLGQLTVRQRGNGNRYTNVDGGTDITIRIKDTAITPTVKASVLSAGGYDKIEIEGLKNNDKIEFSFYNRWTYTSSSLNLEDVIEGKTLNIDCSW